MKCCTRTVECLSLFSGNMLKIVGAAFTGALLFGEPASASLFKFSYQGNQLEWQGDPDSLIFDDGPTAGPFNFHFMIDRDLLPISLKGATLSWEVFPGFMEGIYTPDYFADAIVEWEGDIPQLPRAFGFSEIVLDGKYQVVDWTIAWIDGPPDYCITSSFELYYSIDSSPTGIDCPPEFEIPTNVYLAEPGAWTTEMVGVSTVVIPLPASLAMFISAMALLSILPIARRKSCS